MGDKPRARRIMSRAGVPVLPGSEGTGVTELREAQADAKRLGYPVLIKAAAGGGGKGMRVARDGTELTRLFPLAQGESEASFNSRKMYLEKYLKDVRHVEFQILADLHHNAIHLGERDCSIQRRHQKLIEEAPSPALTEKQRRKLGSTVVDAAKAVQYSNAGTFEFLLDPKGQFFFLEVNTRLQVEHPVTECITGIDIVKEQIRVAAGQRLSVKQSDITFRGHALECRVNAEDPNTFVPSPGVIHAFSVPGGPGVRVDTYAHSECSVSPYYDSLVAKIITWGNDRTEAIARMKRTLEMTVVDGIKTSIPLHLKILQEPDFIAGKLSTAFMERYMPEKKSAGKSLAESA
jgi:acetyl-CoA carboxylase biotin carboxylase subunit